MNNNDASGNENPSTSYTFVLKAQDQNVPQGGPFDLNTNAVFIEPDWNFTPTKAVTAWYPLFPPTQQGWNDQFSLMQTAFSVEDAFHPNLLGSAQFPFEIQLLGDWAQVLNQFKNTACRDFVYFGHGAPNALGQGAASVTTGNIETILQNNQANPLLATNRHPFRFVFLDGCDTAEGNLPQTFGIPKQKGMHALDFVNKRGIRPRAFMGWDRSKFSHFGIVAGAQLYPPHYDYIYTFWSSWASPNPVTGLPETVKDAIAAAAAKDPLASYGMQLYGAEDLLLQY